MKARDRAYYLRRAESELALAQSASHPSAVRAHYLLAGYYLDKVHGGLAAKPRRPAGRGTISMEASQAA